MERTPYMTTTEAARRLRVTRETVIKLIRERGLVGSKIGPRYIVHEDDLERFIKAQRVKTKKRGAHVK